MRILLRIVCLIIGHKKVPFDLTAQRIEQPWHKATARVAFCPRCKEILP